MGCWQLGESNVSVPVSPTVERDKCLETRARFHHAYARHLSLAGDGDASRVQIRAAVKAWPGIRLAIVDDVKIFTGACQRKKGKSSISARFWVNRDARNLVPDEVYPLNRVLPHVKFPHEL